MGDIKTHLLLFLALTALVGTVISVKDTFRCSFFQKLLKTVFIEVFTSVIAFRKCMKQYKKIKKRLKTIIS